MLTERDEATVLDALLRAAYEHEAIAKDCEAKNLPYLAQAHRNKAAACKELVDRIRRGDWEILI